MHFMLEYLSYVICYLTSLWCLDGIYVFVSRVTLSRHCEDAVVSNFKLLAGVWAMFGSTASWATFELQNTETDETSTFFRAWCMWQLVSICFHWPQQKQFYSWFLDSGLSESKRRGLGTVGYAVFGFMKCPILTGNQFKVVAYMYVGVLMAAFGHPTTPLWHFLGLLLSILYHSSLWAERASSHHREILSITLWMYVCLAPDLSHASAAFRLHICSIYTMSLVQKTATSIFRCQSWPRWSPHGFLWKSMWAKPWFPSLQKFVFLHPCIAHLGGWISVACELGPLLSLFFPVQHLAYAALMAMHVAVVFLQGIDYVSYWTASLLVGLLCPSNTLQLASSWSSMYFCPMLLLLGAQVLFALTTAENFNINLPPLMSCPMFVTIARLDDKCHQHYVMTLDGEVPYERIEWMYPFVKAEYGMSLLHCDVAHFPMPFVAFGWGGSLEGAPSIFHRWFSKIGKGFYLMTNVPDFPEDLRFELESIVSKLHGIHQKASNVSGAAPDGPDMDPYLDLQSLADRCEAARIAFSLASSRQKGT